MFVFYGCVKSAPGTYVPYYQKLRITANDSGTVDPVTGETVINNHGSVAWKGTGGPVFTEDVQARAWDVTFVRDSDSPENGPSTLDARFVMDYTSLSGYQGPALLFEWEGQQYYAPFASTLQGPTARQFPGGTEHPDNLNYEYAPLESYALETAWTEPGDSDYVGTLLVNQTGGNTMADVNEILVKSYLNLERDPVNTYHAASKNYVDTAVGTVNGTLTTHTESATVHVPSQNAAGYVFLSNATATSAGTWTAYGTAGTDVADGGTKLVTGGAVYAYLNSHYSAFTDKSLVTTVTSGNANAVTSGAVYSYVQSTVLNKSGTTGATALATTNDTKVPSSKLVAEYVAAQITAAASDYAGASHTHSGADITSGKVGAAYLPDASTSAKGIVQIGSGLTIPTSGDDNGKLAVNLGNGLEPNSGAVQIKLQSSSGLTLNASGLKVDTNTIKSDFIGTTEGKAPALDSAGKLSINVMPARVIGGEYLGEATNQAGMIAMSNATVGDFVKRTDTGTYWMLGVDGDEAYKTAANWFEYAGAVASVNGQIGTVSLSASDVSAIASSALVTTVASTSTDTTVPSAKAVYTFVNENYAQKTHNHNASEINAGTLNAARLPNATTTAKGAVIVGTGLKVTNGTITPDFLAASSGTYDTTNTTKPITAAAAKSIADAAASSATAAAAKGKIYTITGNGTDSSFTCTHGLGIENVLVQVFDSTGKQVLVAVEKTSTAVTFKFAAAPASGTTYTAVILGVQEAS